MTKACGNNSGLQQSGSVHSDRLQPPTNGE